MRRLTHLQELEAESIHIFREVVAEFQRPVMLYSIGKDSSVMLRLAQKAFFPGKIPFPLLHIDTGYKFREMIEFRDRQAQQLGLRLIVHTNQAALDEGTNPFKVGTQRCCELLKTQALLDALRAGGLVLADDIDQTVHQVLFFEPLWKLYNSRIGPAESVRVFPLSNWTEMDVWQYIHEEDIPIVPLYFARLRPVLVRGESLLSIEQPFVPRLPGESPQILMCRMRSLGCSPCTGAIRSDADTLPKIIAELVSFRRSERENRVIDHDQDGSMELKKRAGYF